MNVQLLLALRYLNGRKLRSFLTTLAIVFGVMVIFGINTMLPTMMAAFQATMLAGADKVDLSIAHRTNEAFPAELVDTVRAVDGVRVAQGILSRPLNLPADFFDGDPQTADKVATLTLAGLEVEPAQAMRPYPLQEGRFLQAGEPAAGVITASLADSLQLKLGDTLTLPSTAGLVELTIVGIRPPRAMPGNEEVLVSLPQAQQMFNLAGKINTIEANEIATTDEARRAEIEQAVAASLPADYQIGALVSGSELFASLKMAQSMFTVFGILALFMGGFIIFNTFRTLVVERRRDIGMLRAVGANRRTIIGIILTEGLLQGVLGTLIGIATGYLLARAALLAVSPMMETFIHIRIGEPVVSTGMLVVAAVMGIGVTLLAGLLPAFSAGRISPLEALRPGVADGIDRRTLGISTISGIVLIVASLLVLVSGNGAIITVGALLFLFGLVLLAPILVRPIALLFGVLVARILAREGTGYLAQGNLTRQPGRAAVTASTTMIALAILVTVGGISTSVRLGFLGIVKQSLGSDYLLIPPAIAVWGSDVGANTRLVEQIRAVEGVGPVSSLRYAAAIADIKPVTPVKSQVDVPGGAPNTDGTLVSLMGIDPVTFPQVSGLSFEKGAPADPYAALASGRTLIANGIFAASAGLKVGDTVPMITPAGRVDYRVVGVASDYMNAKVTTAYISHANLAQDYQKSEDILIQINLKPGADRPAVEAALKTIKEQYPQFSLVSGEAYYQQTEQLFNLAFSSMFIVFIFLTIPSLIAMLNTLAIGVLERTREIGMLRAVGATQRQVRRMVMAEALLLALVGTAFGLLAGVYLCYALLTAFSLAGFPMGFVFPWTGLVYAAVVGIVFGLLASILPARQAARLEIVKALRYE